MAESVAKSKSMPSVKDDVAEVDGSRPDVHEFEELEVAPVVVAGRDLGGGGERGAVVDLGDDEVVAVGLDRADDEEGLGEGGPLATRRCGRGPSPSPVEVRATGPAVGGSGGVAR